MYDAIVVGLGGMGSAIAAQLAKRGQRVLGIEQFARGHEFGASAGRSRIIRKAYFEGPRYVPMLARAYELWRELELATGTDLLRTTGMVTIGAAQSPAIAGALASAAVHRLSLEELGPHDLCERFPALALRAGERALFEGEAGILAPEASIEAHLTVAEAHGAILHFGERVVRWETTGAHEASVTVGNDRRFTARSLVFSIGPWFDRERKLLTVPLVVQRNVQAWFRPVARPFGPDVLPIFFVDRPEYPKPLYGFPDLGDGVKVAFHGFGEETTPTGLRRETDDAEVETLRAALDAFLPGAGGASAATKACMYALTPDEDFVIGPHPERANVFVAGGFSGHGFKFCPVVGEIVADLVTEGETAHDIAFLSPQRLRERAR